MPARKPDTTSKPAIRKATKRASAQGNVSTTLPESMLTGKASPAKAAVGDKPVFAYIASLPQPQLGIAERIDALAAKTLPGLQRSVKWGMSYYGVGDGWCFCCGGFADHVKLMFVNGAALVPVPPVTPVAMGKSTRGVELTSIDDINERQIAKWMKQVAAVPGVGAKKSAVREVVLGARVPIAPREKRHFEGANDMAIKAPQKSKSKKAATVATRKTTTKEAPRAATSRVKEPRLLSGGNPQIAKADGDAPVQVFIAAMPGWKRDVGRRLDALVVRTVPEVRKAVRWNTPFYGIEGQGWFLAFHCITKYIKVAFFRGASMTPVPPVASKQKDVRYFHIFENDVLDEKLLAHWIKQASQLPGERCF